MAVSLKSTAMLCLRKGIAEMHYILLCRSLSSAQKAARILQNEGVFAAIVKAPQYSEQNGCAYGVKIAERNLVRAKELLSLHELQIRKIVEVPYPNSGERAR